MPLPPIGRRQFVATAGGMLFCTLAGHHLTADSHVNLETARLARCRCRRRCRRPTSTGRTRVRHRRDGARQPAARPASTGSRPSRPVEHRPHPSRRDDGHARSAGKTKFTALAYRAFSPNFGKPLGPPQIPGPLLEAETGDTIVVNFRNETGTPVTMHPHGIFYTSDMDGSYKGKYTDPGGFVQNRPHVSVRVGGARPGPRARGSTTTTDRWTRCRCSRACSDP